MSIASRIQEIETHIGDVYDTINYSYDTTGINKNIINIPKYLKKGYIDIINNGIDTLYNNFPKVSGIGSSLSLTPTYEAPMKLNEIQGNTSQDGTPTPDTPVEIQSVTGLQNIEVCGKNLCFNITKPSNANLRFFINKSISKTFTISFTTNEALNGNSLYLEVDGTSYGNIGGITASANTKVEKTYTLSDTNYQVIQDGTNIDLLLYKNGANFNIPDDGMVENNSTATEYEPYKGNTYEVNLGKNLLNASQESYTFTAGVNSGQPIIGTINLKANTKYYISYTIDTQMTSNTRSTPFLFLGNNRYYQYETTNVNLTTGRKVWEYTPTTSGTYSFGYWSHTPDVDLTVSKFMISKSSDTTYASYFTPIELNKIGDYQDRIYKDNGKWYVEKQTGKVVLNGSLSSVASTNFSNVYQIYANVMNISYLIGGFCDNFKFNDDSRITDNTNANNYLSDNQCALRLGNESARDRFYVKSTNFASANELKAYFNTNPTTLYYVLTTPEYTEITNTELIEDLETLYTAKSQEGTTNISITSEDLEMILNISALKGDVE